MSATAALPKSRVPRQLAFLNRIARGPGAVKLPSNIQAINLAFKFQNSNGHMGPRKFWRENLPQVQFHNPSIPISVQRKWATNNEEKSSIPATLTILFSDGSQKSVNVQHKHSSDILAQFIEITGATPVPLEDQPLLKKLDAADIYK